MATLQERVRFLDVLAEKYLPQDMDAGLVTGFVLSYVAVADGHPLKEVYINLRKAGIPQEELARARRNIFFDR